MRHRLLASFVGVWTAAVCFAASASTSATAQSGPAAQPSGAAAGAPAAVPATVDGSTPAGDLVAGYCVSCHNERLKTGNLALDKADARQVGNSAETWEKVVVKLRSRAMPPPGSRRPDNAVYDRVAAWLETGLDASADAHPDPGRPGGLHRLNRTEYANAVRDLLAVEIDAKAMLPPDQQAYGFDTNADALSMEPSLLDRYLTAATKIARLAVGDPTMPPVFVRYGAVEGNANEQTWLWQTDRLGEEFPLGSRGGVVARHYFPVDADYIVKLRLQRTAADVIRGLNAPSHIEIRVDGVRVSEFTLGNPNLTVPSGAYDANVRNGPLTNADDALEVRVPIKAGLRTVVATILKVDNAAPEGLGPARIPIWSYEGNVATLPVAISSMLIGGPYNGRVPEDSASRRRVFVCRPAGQSDEAACATKILSTLATRAYRRPTTAEDVDTLVGFYKAASADGGFDAGIRAALERVLLSPDFLFRIEADPPGVAPGAVYQVPDVALASRLSFFLWSSSPDDELLELATHDRLHEPAVLERQVRRMLSDRRARTALVRNFFEEWLQTRNVWSLTPENTRFPWFDDNLRIAFVREIELFLDAQLREDRSVVDLLTSNVTYLNEQLAHHYGVPGVYGPHFRRVTLTDENRFGLLGKASVLAVTSYTTRTSPTIRGKWLLENILAAPIPPPPPNVPALEASNKDNKPLSVREMLEVHRSNPVCASCHARMDPLGFSLENFDAIGQWRTTDAGAAINASGVLQNGTKVDGPAALGRALVAQKELFVRAVAEKLLTYALGRQMESPDASAIRGIVRAAAADDYRWSSTILNIVKSTPFRMRRSAS